MTFQQERQSPDLCKAEHLLNELRGLSIIIEELAYVTTHPEWSPHADNYWAGSYVGSSISRIFFELYESLFGEPHPVKEKL